MWRWRSCLSLLRIRDKEQGGVRLDASLFLWKKEEKEKSN